MPNKDRNKRSVRKARAAERERVANEQAVSGNDTEKPKKASVVSKATQAPAKQEKAKPKKRNRFVQYFTDVRSEMHRVTWPSKDELRNWSVAVIVALVVFGVCVYLVDTGFVALLVGFTGLRG
ncbi:MAG: preprotein translocase subunit SecE [Olegusella sp.]|nr:preprotein translocase subunit SecE [Olegusella sp.]